MYRKDLVAYRLLSVDSEVEIEKLIRHLGLDFFLIGVIKQPTCPPIMTMISCCGIKNSTVIRNNAWN
jgi:hypothetical protein